MVSSFCIFLNHLSSQGIQPFLSSCTNLAGTTSPDLSAIDTSRRSSRSGTSRLLGQVGANRPETRSTRSSFRSVGEISVAPTPTASEPASAYSTPATSTVPTPAPSVSADGPKRLLRNQRSTFTLEVQLPLPSMALFPSVDGEKALRKSAYSLNPTTKRKRGDVDESDDEGDYSDNTPDAVVARRLQTEEVKKHNSAGALISGPSSGQRSTRISARKAATATKKVASKKIAVDISDSDDDSGKDFGDYGDDGLTESDVDDSILVHDPVTENYSMKRHRKPAKKSVATRPAAKSAAPLPKPPKRRVVAKLTSPPLPTTQRCKPLEKPLHADSSKTSDD
jgi:hypothetical protein